MVPQTIQEELIARTWACISGPESKNPAYYEIFDSIETLTAIFNHADIQFCPGLLATIQAPFPPPIKFFRQLPGERLSWGVYATVLKKPGCVPQVYIGSGTEARGGLLSRVRNYRRGTALPKLVSKSLLRNYKITHQGVLLWFPIPPASDVPRLRLLTIALEATLTFLFWAMQSRTKDYGMSSYCPWSRYSFLYNGLGTHNPL